MHVNFMNMAFLQSVHSPCGSCIPKAQMKDRDPGAEYQSINTHLSTAYCIRRVWNRPKLWKSVMTGGVIRPVPPPTPQTPSLHLQLLKSYPSFKVMSKAASFVKKPLLIPSQSPIFTKRSFLSLNLSWHLVSTSMMMTLISIRFGQVICKRVKFPTRL